MVSKTFVIEYLEKLVIGYTQKPPVPGSRAGK